MAEKEKVTLRIQSYDDDNDNEILLQGPIEVWRSVENVSDLALLNIEEKLEANDENWVVYVKNVNDPEKGDLKYRGAYFRYDIHFQAWQEILIGSHSHHNKEILDQISNVDVENLPDGEQKILTIQRRISENGIVTGYDAGWTDIPKGLPDIPALESGNHEYLTVDSQGKLKWSNTFIPTESFVTKQFIVQQQSDRVTITDVVYKSSDEIFIFVGKNFISDYKLEYQGNELTIILENNIFEVGEKVKLLIIKSGIQGVIDEIELNLKQELIAQLSGGTVTLSDYLNKAESDTRYALKQHTHSQFSEKGHNHDYRYADFQHVHREYMTREQVYGILAAAADDESGEIDFDSAVEKIEQSLTSIVWQFRNDMYSRTEIDNLLGELKSEQNNSDNIVVTSNNTSLTEYLEYLKLQIKDSEFIEANEVTLDSGIVQLGEGQTLGGFNDGDRIPSTLSSFLSKLLTRRVKPELVQPKLELKVKQIGNNEDAEEFEIGSIVNLKITPIFTQNDAGEIEEIIFTRSDGLEQIVNIENNKEFETSGFALGSDVKFNITVKYKEGKSKADNLGLNNYFIEAGELSVSYEPVYERYIFMGTSTEEADKINYRSEDIYAIREDIFKEFAKSTIRFNYEENIKSLVFAFPIKDENKTIDIETISYVNQGVDITDLFNETVEVIPGGGTDTGAEYKVYKYEFFNCPNQDIKIKLELR